MAGVALPGCGSSRKAFGGAYELSRVATQLRSMAVSASGDLVATPAEHGVTLIRVGPNAQPSTLDGTDESADKLVFTPDARFLVSSHLPHGNLDMDLAVWDVAGGRLRSKTLISQGITSVAVSDDGRLVAAGCQDGRIRFFDLPDLAPSATVKTESEWLPAIQFMAGTHRVAALGSDGLLAVWDSATGRQMGSRNVGRAFALAASATRIAVVGENSRLLDAGTFQDVGAANLGDATAAGFSPDGAEVAFGWSGPSAQLYAAGDGAKLEGLTCYFNIHNVSAHPVAVSYAGNDHLLVADRDGNVFAFTRK